MKAAIRELVVHVGFLGNGSMGMERSVGVKN